LTFYLFPFAGPDHFETYRVENEGAREGKSMDISSEDYVAVLGGAVLHIQGDQLAAQPLHDAAGGCLLWNGEIFGGLKEEDLQRREEEDREENSVSDTYVVSSMLAQALASVDNCDGSAESCCVQLATKAACCLAQIEGMTTLSLDMHALYLEFK
jgi:asparagine synthetase B (glutamine-hydrolysing)